MDLFVQQLGNGLVVGSTYAIVAIGFALTLTVMRVVNLAHPDILMLSMYLVIGIVAVVTQNLLFVAMIVIAAAALTGLAVERFVLRPFRGRSLLMPMVATAGVSAMIENGMSGVFGADPRSYPALVPHVLVSVGGAAFSSEQLLNVLVAGVLMLIVSIYVRRTRWGRATRALGENADVAAAFGIDVNRVAQVTVSLASVLAAVAGLTLGALYQVATPFIAMLFLLKAFICMLVAGNRHIEGVMLVGLALGVVEALVTGYVSSNFRDAVAFGVLIVVLYVRPGGLFGSYSTLV